MSASDPKLTRSRCASGQKPVLCGGNAQRHNEPEGRALPRFRLYPDTSSMQFDDTFCNREAETGATLHAGVCAVNLAKFLEDAFLISRRDAGPSVGHQDKEALIGNLYLNLHFTC